MIELATRAFEVTLFEDRAEVSRQASVSLAAGRHRLRLTGVGVALDDASLRVTSRTADVKVLSTYVRRQVKDDPGSTREAQETLEVEERDARRGLLEAQHAVLLTQRDEQRIKTLLGQWAVHLGSVPVGGRETLEHWHSAYRTLERRHYKILEERDKATRAMEQARLHLVGVELRLQMARIVNQRLDAAIEVYVLCPEPSEAVLVLKYRTPCAAWRPEHRARLVPPDQLELSTWATIWQATGETWTDVRCLLSTARPTQQASPSLLTDDVLSLRPKTEAEKQTVVVEARDETLAVAGLGRGTRQVSDMPGVDDGGEPVVLQALRPATLPSDGQAVRLEVSTASMTCQVDRVAFPELGEGVHVRALATWNGDTPLLAGPVRLIGGEAAVGVTRIGYVGKGEPFELGFGVDDGLRVRRSVQRTKDTVPVLGTQKVLVKVTDTISNMSERPSQVRVTERYPKSDIGDVKIAVKADGGTVDDRDGYIRYTVALQPNAVNTIAFEYRIEAGPKVQLPAVFTGG